MNRAFSIAIKFLGSLFIMMWLGITFLPSVFGFILYRSKNYNAFNEKHKSINTYLFEKKQDSNNVATFELILYFPSVLHYKYLTIVPEHGMIGLANQPDKNIWVLPGGTIAYMFPSGSFFTPLDGSYFKTISEYHFSNNVIWFNTFDDLKKLGNRIVIQRNKSKD